MRLSAGDLSITRLGGVHMKASKYNFFFPYDADDNKLIAYNSLSNATALMEKDKYKIYTDFCENGILIDDEMFVDQLKYGRFLVDDSCDELSELKMRLLKGRYDTTVMGLTIATTADCNFRCLYCYEKDAIKPVYMNESTENAILDMVKRQIKTLSSLMIVWYGGEPLMNMETFERLSRALINLCEENEVLYDALVITNGYLLTRDVAELLRELKVGSVQITVDGVGDIHNRMRPLSDGSGTYDTIMKNLIDCKGVLPRVELRINTDKDNAIAYRDIVEFLKNNDLIDFVLPYLGMIVSYNSYNVNGCFDACGFSKHDFDFYEEYLSEIPRMWRYPGMMSNFCTADAFNSHVIAADGKLYRCWKDMGNPEKCVGSILDSKLGATSEVFLKYVLFDVTEDEICNKCNFLPVCMGGCPHMRNEGFDLEQFICSNSKFVLDKYLNITVNRKKERESVS